MKETWKLTALLAITLAVLLLYALLPADVAEDLPLKQVDLTCVTGDEELADSVAEVDSTVKEPVDTASQRVLLFGDSMSEDLALRLADYANKNGHKLTCVTWVSSSTRNWSETDTLDHYIQTVQPTHVFVCLGSNELYTADMKSCEKRIRTILGKIGDIPTTWIGPPNWCEDKGYNKLLLQVMGPGRYFPSYKLTFERLTDGRHPTRASSTMWMDKIVEWMNNGLASHPFRLEMPDKRNRHYKQVTILPPGTKSKDKEGDKAGTEDSTAVKTNTHVPTEGETPAAPQEQENKTHESHETSVTHENT